MEVWPANCSPNPTSGVEGNNMVLLDSFAYEELYVKVEVKPSAKIVLFFVLNITYY